MIRKTIAVGCATLLILTGCSTQKVSQDRYDQVVQENQTLKSRVADLEKQSLPVPVKIHGAFTATVKALIPNENIESNAPNFVVLETFQGGDIFVMYIVSSKAETLKVGEQYRFELEETVVTEKAGITGAMLENKDADLAMVCDKLGIPVKVIRAPEADELGLESVSVFWEKQ